ncbi:MAG: hypothetical protein ABH843_00440 [Candidatus Omnitrophota bacterium]
MEKEKERIIELSLIAVLFLSVFFINLPMASIEFLQPDGCGYLDMGRNLFTGKGAVISYNINQYWSGKYYPFLPYMQPLYGIIAGGIWLLFGLSAVSGFNILLMALSCVLLYKILRMHTDKYSSFLISIFVGFSTTLLFVAIAPLTEQLNLFILILTIFVYLRYDDRKFLVGLLLALNCLVRASSLYIVFWFMVSIVVISGFSKEKLKGCLKVAAGFLAAFLSYEIFCYIRYGVFYPEYLLPAKIYRSAAMYPGAFYQDKMPTLNMPALKVGADIVFTNIGKNIVGFIENFQNLKFVLLLIPPYVIFNIIKKRNPLSIIFFFQGLGIIVGYTLSHTWDPVYEFARFSVIPFTMLASLGFLAIRDIFSNMLPERIERRFPVVFFIIISIFFYFHIIEYKGFRNFYLNIYPQKFQDYTIDRDMMYEWIKKNTGKEDLIATTFLRDAVFLDRPVVSVPRENWLSRKNVEDFIRIYKPKYVLTKDKELIVMLDSLGFKLKNKSKYMILLGEE